MTGFRDDDFSASMPASDEIRQEGWAEKHVLIDNGGLSSFHHFEEEEEGSGKAKTKFRVSPGSGPAKTPA